MFNFRTQLETNSLRELAGKLDAEEIREVGIHSIGTPKQRCDLGNYKKWIEVVRGLGNIIDSKPDDRPTMSFTAFKGEGKSIWMDEFKHAQFYHDTLSRKMAEYAKPTLRENVQPRVFDSLNLKAGRSNHVFQPIGLSQPRQYGKTDMLYDYVESMLNYGLRPWQRSTINLLQHLREYLVSRKTGLRLFDDPPIFEKFDARMQYGMFLKRFKQDGAPVDLIHKLY